MDLSESPAEGCFQRHPWELARTAFFQNVLQEQLVERRPMRVLDVGAGDGWFASQLLGRLPSGAEIVCWDAGYEEQSQVTRPPPGLRFCAERPSGAFELGLMMDVLEHVEDDAGFLRSVVEGSLENGSLLLVSVPAWDVLMSSHDVALRHHRRYRPDQARQLLRSAGLTILRDGGLFHGLLAVRALAVAKEALFGRPTPASAPPPLIWRGPEWLARVVAAGLRWETEVSALMSRGGLAAPGLSWWALCQK